MVLLEVERKVFHSVVAKLLYLLKQARLDILTAVSFYALRLLELQSRMKEVGVPAGLFAEHVA